MKILKSIDFLGSNLSWKILGKDKYSTNLSCFLSLLLIILIISKFVKVYLDIYVEKSTYNLKTTFLTKQTIKINLKNMNIAICGINEDWTYLEKWDNNIMLSYKFYNSTLDNGKTINYTITNKCNKTTRFKYFTQSFEECYCHNIDNYNITESMDDEYSMYEIFFTYKDNNTVLKNRYYAIFITDNFYEYTNDNPVQETFQHFVIKLDYNQYLIKELFFNLISYNENLYDLDLFTSKGIWESIYTLSERTNDIQYNPIPKYKLLYSLLLKSNKKEIRHEIYFFTIDYLLAASSGMFQLFYLIFDFICSIYNQYFLYNEILIFNDNQFKKCIDYNIIDNYDRSSRIINDNKYKRNFMKIRDLRVKIDNKKIIENYLNHIDFDIFVKMTAEISLLKKILFDINNIKIFELLCCQTKLDEYKINDIVDHNFKDCLDNSIEKKLKFVTNK